MAPQGVLGCPSCGMRITGNESECPRCHQPFSSEYRLECPFCGGSVPRGSERCPHCQIDLTAFGGPDQGSVEQKTDSILEDLIRLESSLRKEKQEEFSCPDCSWLLDGTETKCPQCGRVLADDSQTCPICMSKIRKDSKVCGNCGAVLRKEESPEPAPSARPAPASTPIEPVAPVGPKSEYGEQRSLPKCPYCGALAGLETTACSKCGKSLVPAREPEQPKETLAEAAADEAMTVLGEIERQARGPRTRKLKPGKVTTIEKRGGANARGLSNGLGQVNGTSMVNGRGRTNGTGKVNGRVNGRVNGTGAVNGRSMVNGRGLSNGLGSSTSTKARRSRPFGARWQIMVLLIAVVVVIPTFIFLTYSGQSEPIRVDGDPSDWAEIATFGSRTQSGLPSIDIAEWATVRSGSTIYLVVNTVEPPMALEEVESFFLFIDSDASASTGYLTDGIGADYVMQFEGWNGSVQTSFLMTRAPGADQYDWNAWIDAGSTIVRKQGTCLEGKCVLQQPPVDSARFILLSKDASDRSSVTYAAPSNSGLLVVTLEPSADVSADGVVASTGSVSLLTARFECQGLGGTVSAVSPEMPGVSEVAQIQPFSLSPGKENGHVVVVTANTSMVQSGELITANLNASGITSSFTYIQIVGDGVGAYVDAAPQDIVIDGAFGDWAGKTTIDQDSPTIQNENIDIESTGNYSVQDSTCFYVSVKGELYKGSHVPIEIRKPSGTGTGGNDLPTRKTGEDILRVYIDSDRLQSTGLGCYYGSKAIGADHKVEISGINGRIVSSTYWNYSSGHWVESGATILSAKDTSQIELSVGINLTDDRSDIDFMVETTCWKNEFDRASFDPTMRTLRASISGTAHIESWAAANTNSAWATSMSYQRKLFWDGTNFWNFYFDGSNTACQYSTTGGATWTSRGAVFKTAGVNETSVWYDSTNNVVYAVGDTSTASANVYIQKGTVAPATHTITWAASDSTLSTSTVSLSGKNTFVSRDANGYIWVLSNNCTQSQPAKYALTAFRSTSANSITAWSYSGQMLANPGSDVEVRGSIVPAGTGSNMWSIYGYGGSVASRKYTGTWQTPQTTIYAAGGQGTSTEIAPPSAVVDSRGVVHVIYGTGRKSGSVTMPSIEYAHNDTGATTYTTSVDLDPSLPNGLGDIYPTISLETSTDNLYVFWLRTDSAVVGRNVTARKCVDGTWTEFAIGGITSYPKRFLTSIYSASGSDHICWQWTENATAPIRVLFDKIPEFGDTLVPVFSIAAMCAVWITRSRKRPGRQRGPSLGE